ncbi:MAG TPA: hypothetical protein PKA95_00450 [Thermomicrobiales bacterium]|nr:hypothetical protein [Thermomicrobiales bacterium]
MATRRQPGHRENVESALLPGGNLLSAALDRQVMIWSDRGGASRHIGDRWAVRCDEALRAAIGTRWPIPHDDTFEILDILRLDDVPEVSREANLNHLENPDFLLIGARNGHDQSILQAVDAKFAPDRIKPSQVSAEVVGNLLDLEGAAHRIVVGAFASHGLGDPSIVRGVFISPASEMSEFLLRRVTSGRRASVDRAEVVMIPPHPDRLFAGLPESRVIGPLARIDALPVTPRNNLISAIYYFRLSCACFYFWGEEHRPLLSLKTPPPPEPGRVAAIVSSRAEDAASAYELVERWAVDVEPQVRARTAVSEVAALPVRIRELRSEIDRAGLGGDNKALRLVRRDLELAFRERLHETVGDILADDPRPLSQILDDVASASRSLRGEMLALMRERIAAAGSALRDAANGGR